MQIELLSKTPNFLDVSYTAARTCYAKESPIQLMEKNATLDEKLRLLRHIILNGHHSVLEHCQMSFAVQGVSRNLLAQFTRHRIGLSFSVQSQRYVSNVNEDNKVFDYIIPDTIKANEDALYEYEETMQLIQLSYNELLRLGIPKQDARCVLPGGICTNLVTSFNLRSFLDVYLKRVIKRGAQDEIVSMLIEMRNILVKKEPWLEEYLPIPLNNVTKKFSKEEDVDADN